MDITEKVKSFLSLISSLLLLTPIVLALVQFVKSLGIVPKKFLPLVGIMFGISGALLFTGVTSYGFLAGLVLGLSATGLYEVGKNATTAPTSELG